MGSQRVVHSFLRIYYLYGEYMHTNQIAPVLEMSYPPAILHPTAYTSSLVHYTISTVCTGMGIRVVSGSSPRVTSVVSFFLALAKLTASLHTSLVTHIRLSSRKNLTSRRMEGRCSTIAGS